MAGLARLRSIQRFGAVAKNKLAEAKTSGNRELLAEGAQRFRGSRIAGGEIAKYLQQVSVGMIRDKDLHSNNVTNRRHAPGAESLRSPIRVNAQP